MPRHQYRLKAEQETKLQDIFDKLGIQGDNESENHRKMIDLVYEKLFDKSNNPLSQGESNLAVGFLINLAQCYYRAEDLENPRYVFCNGKRMQITVCKNKQDRYLSKDNLCVPEDIRKERMKYLDQQRKRYNIPRSYRGKSSLGIILTPADILRMDREAKERRLQEEFRRLGKQRGL